MTGHRVDHHEDLVGLDRIANSSGFSHHLLIDMQATCGVDDDHIAQRIDRIAHALLSDLDRILAIAAIDAHADLITQRLELIGCCGAVYVARNEQGVVILLLQEIRELRGCCGLT